MYETGHYLEDAVISALKVIGYEAKEFDDGTLQVDQVITSPEGIRFLGECEGKENKAIAIDKIKQLVGNLSEDLDKNDSVEIARGLLFGNPQRLLPVNERTVDFTDKCKNFARIHHIGLIKTADLFFIVKYLHENSDEQFKAACRDAILKQLGGVIKFPDIPVKAKETTFSPS